MSVNCIRNILEVSSQTHTDKVALIHNQRTLTYAEMFKKVNQIAHYFTELNLPKGSRIGIYSNKSIEQIIAILALLSTEYIFVPITRFLKPEQVEYIVNDCDIQVIITDKTKVESISKSNFKGKVITYEAIDKESVSFDEIYKYYNEDFKCTIKSHNNAVITYSFASSGFPRGACIYKGYWNSPEDTKMRFKSIKILDKVLNLEGDLSDEIVIASGDFVYKDEEGYIYFHSRKDEMIKTSGYRVSPEEIEKVVFDNIKEIESCAVFGVENEMIEEEIVMVYASASELSKNEILFELKKHLPNYMIPMQVVYKKSIPLHFGKINKAHLKEQL